MIEQYIMKIILVPVMIAIGIVLGLLLKGLDRMLSARMQARVGPPITQPFRDIKKLFIKENIVPKDAVKWLFHLMPIVSLVSSLVILFYIPIGGMMPVLEGHGDIILVLYLLLIPSLSLVIGGFVSASPYSRVGAQREMVTMLSYEFPLAIAFISVAWLISISVPGINAFSFSVISANLAWSLVGPAGFLGLLLLLIIMILVMPGELGNIPFDVGHAETEIAGGILSEYSGRNLALFYLSDAVKMVVFGSIVIALFMPQGIASYFGLVGYLALAINALFYLLKLFVVLFIGSMFVRVAIARLRINQVVKVYWGYATVIALLGLVLIGIDILVW